jgi:hypothetical protein
MQPPAVTTNDLEAEYREAAADMEDEAEALAWIETNIDEALD